MTWKPKGDVEFEGDVGVAGTVNHPDATSGGITISSPGNVGVGTSSPQTALHVQTDGGGEVVRAIRSGDDANPLVLRIRRSRGTNASPTVVGSTDFIGAHVFDAHDGTAFRSAAQIRAAVDGTPGANDMPGRLEFHTTADGASSPTERMRITRTGNVGIGTNNPIFKVQIQDASTSSLGLVGNSATYISLNRYSSNSSPAVLQFMKYRGSSTSQSIVSINDVTGDIVFYGYDGSFARPNARIRASVDGTPTRAGDMPGRISFYTTPDGGTTENERMRINNAGLITGSGTSLGAWTAYTPTLGGTGTSLGSGTAVGYYCQIGKVISFKAQITLAANSIIGAGGATVSLPEYASSALQTTNLVGFTGLAFDTSASAQYPLLVRLSAASTVYIKSSASPSANSSPTVPFTWATGDVISISGTYEAA